MYVCTYGCFGSRPAYSIQLLLFQATGVEGASIGSLEISKRGRMDLCALQGDWRAQRVLMFDQVYCERNPVVKQLLQSLNDHWVFVFFVSSRLSPVHTYVCSSSNSRTSSNSMNSESLCMRFSGVIPQQDENRAILCNCWGTRGRKTSGKPHSDGSMATRPLGCPHQQVCQVTLCNRPYTLMHLLPLPTGHMYHCE